MQLGRYTILGRLAVGGMAEVLLARLDGSAGFEREVIIKRVLTQFASDGDFRRLFQQEARFASFLVHPHITQVIDFGVDDAGAAYLVMEFVDGASLRKLLTASARQRERPDVRLVCRIFSQLAEALATVHAAIDPQTRLPLELVHRDVNPDNVLLSRQGAVKLADFGIARAMNEVSLTRPDLVRGKLRYMAPEQLLGRAIGPAIDVWALGVSLYEALTLKRPFPEENEGATTHAIASVNFTPIEALRDDLPPELVEVVNRCLREDPAARWPSCQDLSLALERIATAGTTTVTAAQVGNWVDRLCPGLARDALQPAAVSTPAWSPTPSAPPPVAPPIDLQLRAPPTAEVVVTPPPPAEPTPTPAPTPTPRRSWRGVWAVGVLLALTGVAFVARPRLAPQTAVTRQVLVTSTPSGATLHLGERELGATPWSGDLPAGQKVELSISAPGFVSRKLLVGATETKVDVALKRR